MEIIKHGNTKGYLVECPHCGCTFTFLETEATMGWSPKALSIRCPECREIVGQDHFQVLRK